MTREYTHNIYSDQVIAKNGGFPKRTVHFILNRPGMLSISAKATGHFNLGTSGDVLGAVISKPFEITFPCKLFDPDGRQVPLNSKITSTELQRWTDLRGTPTRRWRLDVEENQLAFDGNKAMTFLPQHLSILVNEKVQVLSAPPLIDAKGVLLTQTPYIAEFDLWREGTLRVNVRRSVALLVPFPIRLELLDPEGNVFGNSSTSFLSVRIGLRELMLSRDTDQKPRKWKLRISRIATTPAGPFKVEAQVFRRFSIPVSILKDRLNAILGATGENVSLRAQFIVKGKKRTNKLLLKINSERLAATLDLHDVLENINPKLNPGVDLKRPKVGIDYVLLEKAKTGSELFGTIDWEVQARNLAATAIRVGFGESVERRQPIVGTAPGSQTPALMEGNVLIPAGIPKIRIEIDTVGSIYISADGDDGELVFPDLQMELAIGVSPLGRIAFHAWIDPNAIKHGNEGAPWPGGILWTAQTGVGTAAKDMQSLSETVEGIFDRLLGGAYRFTSARWGTNSFEFEYIAGLEPERKRNPGYVARGQSGTFGPVIPTGLGKVDTWVSPNLVKIDHIVVLMMENRSFDHVLGYLSLPDVNGQVVNPKIRGLTPEVVAQFSSDADRILPLRDAAFAKNKAGLRTKLPLSVGHELTEVAQQIAAGSMRGFVENFRKKHSKKELDEKQCHGQEVLGYYTDRDLHMYGFLSQQFAVCDHYFCSHPGPTIPNRMFSLMGDVHRNRFGEPRLDNGFDAEFALCRDRTIFDLLTQRQVTWRVYESLPSVTMLRMFARHATDATNIRNISNLEADLRNSGLPSVTFVDPALHDAPANDDHPPADMLNGQHLVRRMYEALRANPAVLAKTLFIVTYDEHGGLFDHVPPPIAEVLRDPQLVMDEGSMDAGIGGSGTKTYKPDQTVTYGVRVPTFLVSPWVNPGDVVETQLDHTSILKTILIRFCGNEKPFLGDRVHHAFDLGRALTLAQPRNLASLAAPVLPAMDPVARSIAGQPVPLLRKQDLSSERAQWHDYMALLSVLVR